MQIGFPVCTFAVELFHELCKALEVLTDPKAKAAYDAVLKAKEQARLRTQALDAKRKKFKQGELLLTIPRLNDYLTATGRIIFGSFHFVVRLNNIIIIKSYHCSCYRPWTKRGCSKKWKGKWRNGSKEFTSWGNDDDDDDRQTDRHVFIWGLIQRKCIDYNFQISKNYK